MHKYIFLIIAPIALFSLLLPWHFAHAGVIVKPLNNLGLVGYWDFNEKTGTNAEDKSGNKNNGTLTNGPTRVAGKSTKFGDAISFDGSNDIVSTGTTGMSTTISTWELWIKPSNVTVAQGIYTQAADTGDVAFRIRIGSDSTLCAGIGWVTDYCSTTLLNADRWQHLAITRNSSSWAMYINGVQERTWTDGNSMVITASTIGRFTNGASWFYFNGLLDDVRIYNRALSATEISALYNKGLGSGNLVSARVPHTGINKGLVGYWNFNEADGATAFDQTTSGNKGTLTNGPTRLAGKDGFGKAISFDGSDDYVDIASNHITTSNDWTLTGWVYQRTTGDTTNKSVIAHGDDLTPGGVSGFSIFKRVNAPLRAASVQVVTGTDTETVLNSNAEAALNSWTHVAVSKSGTNLALYINGVQDITTTLPSANMDYTANTPVTRIGARPDGAGVIDGLIDDVRIYNRALTADEVRQLYNSSKPAVQAVLKTPNNLGLVGYWPMNEGSGTSAGDFSGNKNHGTLTNGPVWTTGKLGKALSFDGSNDYVDAGGASSLKPTVAITISAWIYIDSVANDATAGHIISTSRVVTPTGGYALLWDDRACCGNTNAIVWTVSAGDNTYGQPKVQNVTNGWRHVVGTYDKDAGGTNEVKLYIDSVLSATADYSSAIGQSPTNLRFASSDGTQEFYKGSLDDVRIYNRALSATEVSQLYNKGFGR